MISSNWQASASIASLVIAAVVGSLPGTLFAEQRQGAAQNSGPSQARQEHNTNRIAAKPKVPVGITAVNSVDSLRAGKLFDTRDATLNVYANPNTSGVTFRTSWADVEPKEGKCNYSKLDTVFDNAEKHSKWVELILIPGFGTPAWAMKDVKSDVFAISYGRGAGTSEPLPAPWDKTYLTRWFAFLKAISDRYGDRPSFRMIAAAGPTSVSAEMSLPDDSDEIAKWKKLGYNSETYVDAWNQTFSAYSSAFPRQYFSLALHRGLPIPNQKEANTIRDKIINLGLKYPGQFALEEDGLNSLKAETYGYRVVLDYSGQIVTGFMMTTAATLRPQRMGSSSNPADDLAASINTGLVPNSKGQIVKFLEIYEPDILNSNMQNALQAAQVQLLKNSSN
jgi:hypothetical protein